MPVADFADASVGLRLREPLRADRSRDADDLRAFVDRAHSVALGVILRRRLQPLDSDELPGHFSRLFTAATRTTGVLYQLRGTVGCPCVLRGERRYGIDEYHIAGGFARAGLEGRVARARARELRGWRVQAGRGRQIYLVAENEPSTRIGVRLKRGESAHALWNDDTITTRRCVARPA